MVPLRSHDVGRKPGRGEHVHRGNSAPRKASRSCRGVFHSVPHLESCLKQYIETYNENPRPFTKSAAQIIEKVDRARKALAAASA